MARGSWLGPKHFHSDPQTSGCKADCTGGAHQQHLGLDIKGSLSVVVLTEYLHVWDIMKKFVRLRSQLHISLHGNFGHLVDLEAKE